MQDRMTRQVDNPDPALDTFSRSRFRPAIGMILNGTVVALLVPDFVDRTRLGAWLAIGLGMTVVFLIDGLRNRYEAQRVWGGVPFKVHAIALTSGLWLGALALIDPVSTRDNEFAYLITIVVLGTVVRLMLYGSMGLVRYVWLGSLIFSATVGFAIAGQWSLVVAVMAIGLAAYRISIATNEASIELHTLRAESEEREVRALQAAETDALTGLLNRRGLRNKANDLQAGYCLFIDLDHFKVINDTYGHDAGDEVLTIVGKRLAGIVGDRGLAARLGGDEFLVLFERAADGETLAKSVLRKIQETIAISTGDSIRVSASGGGVAVTSADVLELVIRRSDDALYLAKEAGRDRLVSGSDLPNGQRQETGDVRYRRY